MRRMRNDYVQGNIGRRTLPERPGAKTPTRRWLLLGAAAALAVALAAFRPAVAADVHVSVHGRDDNPGSPQRPVKTLARAVQVVRGLERPVTIWLDEGIHRVDKTVRLTREDNGKPGAPLTIRGRAPGKAIVSGGAELPSKLFRPVTDPKLLPRLAPKARGKVVAASLAARPDLHAFFTPPPREHKRPPYAMLTWSGFVLQQARWPNRGYAYIAKVTDKGPTTRWGWKPVPYDYAHPIGARFSPRRDGLLPDESSPDFAALAAEFQRTHDMTVVGYLNNDWYYQFEPVGRIDHKTGQIQMLGPTRYGVGNTRIGLPRRFALVNVLCCLDEPGEWYYDHRERLLYLWPVRLPSDEVPVRISTGPELIGGRGVQHVVLRDLVFENLGREGVSFFDSDYVLVGGCTFRAGLGRALRMYGTHNAIMGCDFHDVTSAFSVGGRQKNRLALIPEHNVILNNHLYRCRRRGYGLAYFGGVGVRFAHNLLHDQNGGVFYGDNEAVIEYNEFYDMGYEMGDWNPLYNGADLAKQNNRVRFNLFHHLMETPRGYPIAAARADDGGSGLRAIGNILYKCGRAAFEFHGPANEIRNNVAMETPLLWQTLQRPYEQTSREEFLNRRRAEDRKMRGTYAKEDLIGKAERLLGKEFWTRDFVWTRRYPHLRQIFLLSDWDHIPWNQGYCRIENNFMCPKRGFPIHVHGHNRIDTAEALRNMLPSTTVFEPPRAFDARAVFVDVGRLDFRLRSGASLPDGFPRIEFDRIGLYTDPYRPTVPDKAKYRAAVAEKYRGVRSHGGRLDFSALNRRYPPPAYLSRSFTRGAKRP